MYISRTPDSYRTSIFSCLCKTNVVENVVFDSVQELSARDIMDNLFIGATGPQKESMSFTGDGDGFKYYTVGNNIDSSTVFEIETRGGKTVFLKNIESKVHLQGWSLKTPEIFEAESATLYNAVSTFRSRYITFLQHSYSVLHLDCYLSKLCQWRQLC